MTTNQHPTPLTAFFFSMIRPPPRSTLFPTRRSSDLGLRERDRLRGAPDRRPASPPPGHHARAPDPGLGAGGRKSTRLNSSHLGISYAVFCLKKKKHNDKRQVAMMWAVTDNCDNAATL